MSATELKSASHALPFTLLTKFYEVHALVSPVVIVRKLRDREVK